MCMIAKAERMIMLSLYYSYRLTVLYFLLHVNGIRDLYNIHFKE